MTGGEDQEQKVPSYVGISCVISGYGPVGVRGPSPVTSPVKFDCPPLPSARERHPHLFEPENEAERQKSLVQKKIECLYGRHVGEQWSKCNKRSNDGAKGNPESGSRLVDRTQCDGVTPKKEYREPVFKRLDAEFIRQIDSEQGNGNDSTRNGHVLLSLAEAMVETQIQQLLLKSPSAPTDQRLKDDTGSAGEAKVRSQAANERTPDTRVMGASGGVGQADDERDGRSFLTQLEQTCDQMRKRMKETESLIGSEGMDDEMEGKVRCVIGKADLLLTKKLAQFRQLCLQNINHILNEDGFETKVQDLTGFWEMVSIQVQEVNKNLDDIIRLSHNNWIDDETEEKGPKNRSRKSSPKDSPLRVSSLSEESQAKELQRRERLREAKKKIQSERKASSTADADVAIFVSENKKPAAGAEAANDLI